MAVLKEAKLDGKGYTFHSWRHTFRTRLSEAGVSDDLAKRLGGWTEDATAARYDHAERVEELRAAVRRATRALAFVPVFMGSAFKVRPMCGWVCL